METDFRELIGKRVKNSRTGEITTVESYAKNPSVSLGNGISFCIGSPISKDWEMYTKNKRWNLRHEGFEIKPYYQLYQHKHIKNCRDLIIEDIDQATEEYSSVQYSIKKIWNDHIKKIIKKRFGNM